MEFPGYERPDGKAGIRNYVLVLPASRCANELAANIADGAAGAIPILHNHNCARLQPDTDRAFRVLAGLGRNANVAGTVVVGIGCDNISVDELAESIAAAGKPVAAVSIEKQGSFQTAFETGRTAARQMLAAASQMQRTPQPLAQLCMGVKCGGSGTISSLAGHPATGHVLDRLIAEGGTAIFTETAEVIGAEHIMAKRAVNEDVAKRLLKVVGRFEQMIVDYGVDIRGAQPSPGNIKSGLTTLEEKSLGAMVKTGTSPLSGVLEYAETPPGPGLYLMDSSAWPSQLFLGMAAAGAQCFTFSVGGGLPARFRSQPGAARLPIVPTIKVTGDPNLKDELEYFDVYAGEVVRGAETATEAGERFFSEFLQVAAGKPTAQEYSGYREMFDMYATGPIM